MGNQVSRVVGTFTRPFRNYNVRERAHQVMDRLPEIPKAAPKHPTTEQVARMLAEAQPPLEEFSRKDDGLLDKLKTVYVTSADPKKPENPEKSEKRSSRPLPSFRGMVPMADFGYTEPRYIPEGKIPLLKAVDMITEYSADPKTNTVATLSATYKMSEADVEAIVTNFSAFQLYVQGDNESKYIKRFIPTWLKQQTSPIQIESQSKTQEQDK